MFDYVLSSFLLYQYSVFFFVTLFAAVGFPIPATALILAAGAFYSQGYFDIIPLFLSGFIGCILGDMIGYSISYRFGKEFFCHIGLRKLVYSRQFLTFEPVLRKHAIVSVILSRFLFTGLGPMINILAGIIKMPKTAFILSDIFGELVYITIFLMLGWSLGSEWEYILGILESFSTLFASIGLCSILLVFMRRYRNRKMTLQSKSKMGRK